MQEMIYDIPGYGYNYFLSGDKKFNYYYTPKCGSVTFRKIREFKFDMSPPIKTKDRVNVTIFRNPYKRVISSLLWHYSRGWFTDLPWDIDMLHQEGIVFEYVDKCLLNHVCSDAGLIPQSVYLSCRGVSIDYMDDVLLLETFDDDFNKFKEKHNLTIGDFKHLNNSEGKVGGVYTQSIRV